MIEKQESNILTTNTKWSIIQLIKTMNLWNYYQLDEIRKYHPEWSNQITKEHTWYVLTNKWKLAPNVGIHKTQFTVHMKLKIKEYPWVDASFFLWRGNKILTAGNMETLCEPETKGNTTLRLPQLGIHPLCSLQTRKLLWMQGCACWQEPNMVLKRLCQSLTNTEADAPSQPLDWAEGLWWSKWRKDWRNCVYLQLHR